MDNDDFRALLTTYLEPTGDPNPQMLNVRIEWIRGDDRLGSDHIRIKHGVSEQEVEEVLLEIPPFVEAKRSSEHPNRTLFWGATRNDRELLVVCEDKVEGDLRVLTPITAFEPDDGIEYWERL
ncbi:MAG: hypothetical protein HYV07_24040 [Deltaproteobacteria bacterium]|nr:hypothetical protein [Deltaproteobacteria bacterium]